MSIHASSRLDCTEVDSRRVEARLEVKIIWLFCEWRSVEYDLLSEFSEFVLDTFIWYISRIWEWADYDKSYFSFKRV